MELSKPHLPKSVVWEAQTCHKVAAKGLGLLLQEVPHSFPDQSSPTGTPTQAQRWM